MASSFVPQHASWDAPGGVVDWLLLSVYPLPSGNASEALTALGLLLRENPLHPQRDQITATLRRVLREDFASHLKLAALNTVWLGQMTELLPEIQALKTNDSEIKSFVISLYLEWR